MTSVTRMLKAFFLLVASFRLAPSAFAFVPLQQSNSFGFIARIRTVPSEVAPLARPEVFGTLQSKSSNDNDEEDQEEERKENPYQDPNYPELEFVDYSDPDYVVDQGVGDEFFDDTNTEAEIEAMREDRRRRNDEFQFQTYYKELLKEGGEFKGEWSVYQTSTFMKDLKGSAVDANGYPRLLKSSRPLYVTTKSYKSIVETDSKFTTDAERIHHEETKAEYPNAESDDDTEIASQAEEDFNQSLLQSTYYPAKLSAFDFRGEKGIMCVGAAYTICTSVPLVADAGKESDEATKGPFAEYRAETGLLSKDLRFRVKLDYRVKDDDKDKSAPTLYLKSLVVCREMLDRWPPKPNAEYTSASEQVISSAFYGKPGAEGGLYDPPPVGSEEQAGKYMLLDLEGGATILFPYEMEQDPRAFDGNGWVTSLDWTPGTYRYQVDRKVQGGLDLRNLRTLELSEVQSADADQYRPRDGGADMRQ